MNRVSSTPHDTLVGTQDEDNVPEYFKKEKSRGVARTFFKFSFFLTQICLVLGEPEHTGLSTRTKGFDKSISVDFRLFGNLAVTVYELRANLRINQSQSEDF